MAQTPEERRKSHINAVKKAQEKTDAIMLRPSKAEGAAIRSAAAAVGKPVSVFILDAVREKMRSE